MLIWKIAEEHGLPSANGTCHGPNILRDQMTLKRVYGADTILGLQWAMVYGLKFMVPLVLITIGHILRCCKQRLIDVDRTAPLKPSCVQVSSRKQTSDVILTQAPQGPTI